MPFNPDTHDFAHSAARLPSGKVARSREEYDALTDAPKTKAEPKKKAPAKSKDK